MSFTTKDIVEYIEKFAPVRLAEDWDNVGLMVGSLKHNIGRIMVCLDITEDVVAEAVSKKVDLIISHHPLIFKGVKRIVEDDYKGKIIYKLIKNNISVYSAHTNLDVVDKGVNSQLAKALGLINLKNLNQYKADLYQLEKDGEEYGLGKVGCLEKPLDFEDFISLVKNRLKVEKVKVIGNVSGLIKNVAVFCGSFDEDFSGVLREGAEILVTGDIKYHTAVEISEKGLCVVDAGHFNTEIAIVSALVEILRNDFPDIDIIGSSEEKDPFKFY